MEGPETFTIPNWKQGILKGIWRTFHPKNLWRSDFLRKVAGVSATRFFVMGLGFLTSIFIARSLGVEGRGLYVAAYSLGMIGAQLGSLGLNTPNAYLVSRDRGLLSRLVGNSLLAALGVGGMGALATFFFFQAFPQWAPLHGAILALGLLWIPFGILYGHFQNFFIAMHEIKSYIRVEIGSKALQLIAILLACALWTRGPQTYFAGMLVVVAMTCFYQFHLVRGHFRSPLALDLGILKANMGFALKGQAVGIFTLLLIKSDLLVVQYLLGAKQTGYYSVAASFADIIPAIPGVVATILFPRISVLDDPKERWRLAKKALVGVALFLAPFLVLAFVLAEPVIGLVYGRSFAPAARSFQFLIPGIYFLSLQSVAVQLLRSDGFPMRVVVAWAFTVALNVGLNFWLVPRFGIEGAALVSSGCYLLICLLVLTMIRGLKGVPKVKGPGWRTEP